MGEGTLVLVGMQQVSFMVLALDFGAHPQGRGPPTRDWVCVP